MSADTGDDFFPSELHIVSIVQTRLSPFIRPQIPLVPHVSRFTDSSNILYLERLVPKACESLCADFPVASLEDYLNTLEVCGYTVDEDENIPGVVSEWRNIH